MNAKIIFKITKQRYSSKYKFTYEVKNHNELFNKQFYINLGKFYNELRKKDTVYYDTILITNDTIGYTFYCDSKSLSFNQYWHMGKKLIQDLFQAGFIYSLKSSKQILEITLVDRKVKT